MKVTISYADLSEQKALVKALQDCREWLSSKTFKEGAFDSTIELCKTFLKKAEENNWTEERTLDTFAMALSFAGIEGHIPVKAMYLHAKGEL